MAIATINPFTGQTEQTFEAHSEEEVERRIAGAQSAYEALRSTTFAQRAIWMGAAADLLEADVESVSCGSDPVDRDIPASQPSRESAFGPAANVSNWRSTAESG